MEMMITLGPAEEAESIWIDEHDCIHSKKYPGQAFDSHDHKYRDMEFFTAHKEYAHQRHSINMDGTISFSPDPTYVLGTDEKG